jgi:glycosyltransferase involved in cell wall biosynthesis
VNNFNDNTIQVFIDYRVGGPHYFARNINAKGFNSHYIFGGKKAKVFGKKSLFPLLFFGRNSRVIKLFQYFLNFCILYFCFLFLVPRNTSIIIHSAKNYPAILSSILAFKDNVTLVIHEKLGKADVLIIRLIIHLQKTGIIRNFSVYSVAKSILPRELSSLVAVVRYSVPEDEKLVLSEAYSARARTSHRSLRLLLIGNISPVKNYSSFLRLLASVQINIEVVIYGARTGNKNYLKKFDKSVRDFELAGHKVVVMGFKEKLEIWRSLTEFDVFCLPSLSEAAPLVLYEMKETGIPILYSDVGDCSEILAEYKKSRSINISALSPSLLENALLELVET